MSFGQPLNALGIQITPPGPDEEEVGSVGNGEMSKMMIIIMTVTQIYSNLITLFLRSAIAAAPRLENIAQASLSSTIRFSPHLSAKMPYSREIVNLQVRLVAVIDSSCG